jgi:hypothetical protein
VLEISTQLGKYVLSQFMEDGVVCPAILYFQHSVIGDANAMLKQGIYQLPLSCLCIQEKTYIDNKRWFAAT